METYQTPLARPERAGDRAAGYPRVSTRPQHEKGYGERDQAERIAAHIATRGYDTVEMVVDAVSGRTGDRPGLNRIRELARAGAIDVVVCGRLDRLARDEGGYLGGLIEAELKAFGVRVEYAEQEFAATPEGELQKGILRVLAGYECSLIAARTKGGRERKAKEKSAMPNGVKVFGYRQVSKSESEVLPEFHGRSGELLVVPEEAALVRELFQRAAGGASLRALARWLDETGEKPLGGRGWTSSTVGFMLRNPVYVGRPVFRRHEYKTTGKRTASGKSMRRTYRDVPPEEQVQLSCPAVVDEATFRAVHERLAANKTGRSGRPSDKWPLSGCIWCASCVGLRDRKPLTCCGHAGPTGTRTYRCGSSYREGLPFCGARYGADALEEQAQVAIRKALAPGRLAALAKDEAIAANEAAGDPEQKERALQAQLRALDEEEERLLDKAVLGFNPALIQRKTAAIAETRAELEKQLADVKAQAARLRCPNRAAREADEVAAELAEDLEAALADPRRFKELARLLLSIRIFPGGKQPEMDVRVPRSLAGVR